MRASQRKTRLIAAAVMLSGLAVGGCNTVQDALGIGKNPPDEMAVAPRRPLAMPPDYNLRAPQPGAPAMADVNTSNAAARALATSGQNATAAPPAAPAPAPAGDGTSRVMTTSPAAPPSGQ